MRVALGEAAEFLLGERGWGGQGRRGGAAAMLEAIGQRWAEGKGGTLRPDDPVVASYRRGLAGVVTG